MKVGIGKGRHIQLRARDAQDLLDGGVYSIGEIASTQDVNDREYATSVGIAFRNDHIPTDELVKHRKAAEAAKAKKSDD